MIDDSNYLFAQRPRTADTGNRLNQAIGVNLSPATAAAERGRDVADVFLGSVPSRLGEKMTPELAYEMSKAHLKRLGEIAARLKATSPQPWTHIKDGEMFSGTADWIEGPAIEVRGRVYRKEGPNLRNPQVEADAIFIANAPSDIAWLLRRVAGKIEL